MEQKEWLKRKCDVCGKMFNKKSWADRHDYHEPDCDRCRIPDSYVWVGSCVCDLVAHAECCPECAKHL
jgi:hypothetical protein